MTDIRIDRPETKTHKTQQKNIINININTASVCTFQKPWKKK